MAALGESSNPPGEGARVFRTLATSVQCKAQTVAALGLSTGSEHHYHVSTSQTYKEAMDALQQQARQLMTSCQAAVCPATSLATSVAPTWGDKDEVQDWVAALLDDAAAAVDTALDRHKKGEPSQVIPSTSPSAVLPSRTDNKRSKGVVHHAKLAVKPQALFTRPVDNSTTPFVHWAPHLALVPSATAPAELSLPVHPLQDALDQLTYAPWQVEADEPTQPGALEETPLHWVDTPAALQEMVNHLSTARHVAIDLENHSFRSFQGFTCLMQLSSRTDDFVVDTLALRDHLGPALQPMLANTDVVKVLHGSDSDIVWLQRDFHLYVVNMFDTGQAARVLRLASAGLAHLLEHFCGVKADKRYQLADWRVRPLAPEMMAYARSDTHYLLYIYDQLKQQLVQAGEEVPPSLAVPLPSCLPPGALSTVLERSRLLCCTLYAKEVCDAATNQDLMDKWGVSLAHVQQAVFHSVMRWRDGVCREEDESTGYVLPRAQLLTLARQMPVAAKEVVRLAGHNASEPLRRRAHDLAALIASSKATALALPGATAEGLGAAAEVAAAAGDPGLAAAMAAGSIPVGVAAAVAGGLQQPQGAAVAGAVVPVVPSPLAAMMVAKIQRKVPKMAAARFGAAPVDLAGLNQAPLLVPAPVGPGSSGSAAGQAPTPAPTPSLGLSSTPHVSGQLQAVSDALAELAEEQPPPTNLPEKRPQQAGPGGEKWWAVSATEVPEWLAAAPAPTEVPENTRPAAQPAAAAAAAAAAAPRPSPLELLAGPAAFSRASAAAAAAAAAAASAGGVVPAATDLAPIGPSPITSPVPATTTTTRVSSSTFASTMQQRGGSASAAGAAGSTGGLTGEAGEAVAAAVAVELARLRASFALPFLMRPPAQATAQAAQTAQGAGAPAGGAGVGGAAAVFGLAAAPVGTVAAAGSGGSGQQKQVAQAVQQRTTAEEVRSVVDRLKATGGTQPEDIVLGSDGQPLPQGTGHHAAGVSNGMGAGAALAEHLVAGAGGVGNGGQGQGGMEVEEGRGGGGGGGGGGRTGQEVGIPQLEFVPMSLREMKRKRPPHQCQDPQQPPAKGRGGSGRSPGTGRGGGGGRTEGNNGGAGGAGGGRGGGAGGGGEPSKRARYTTGMEVAAVAGGLAAGAAGGDDGGAAAAAVVPRKAVVASKSLFGSDDESGGEDGDESSGMSGDEGAAGGAAGGAGAAGVGGKAVVVKRGGLGMISPALKRGGGKVRQHAYGKQGGRGGGAGGAGGSGSGGGKGGARGKPAFNPYDIPDENLIKGGKRSAVMPRSGNRTMTFK